MTATPNEIDPTLRALLASTVHHLDELDVALYRLGDYFIEKNHGQRFSKALQLSAKLHGDIAGLAFGLDLLMGTVEAS